MKSSLTSKFVAYRSNPTPPELHGPPYPYKGDYTIEGFLPGETSKERFFRLAEARAEGWKFSDDNARWFFTRMKFKNFRAHQRTNRAQRHYEDDFRKQMGHSQAVCRG